MALVDQEQLAGQECVRVYVAGRLREAKRVEQVLTTNGVDYFVAIERFERLLFGIIRREYDGVSFYVPDALAAHCRAWLREAKLIAGIEEPEPRSAADS